MKHKLDYQVGWVSSTLELSRGESEWGGSRKNLLWRDEQMQRQHNSVEKAVKPAAISLREAGPETENSVYWKAWPSGKISIMFILYSTLHLHQQPTMSPLSLGNLPNKKYSIIFFS